MGWFCIVVATTFFFFLLWLLLGRWLASWDHTGQENSSYTRLDNWKQGDGTNRKEVCMSTDEKGRFGFILRQNRVQLFFVLFCFVFCWWGMGVIHSIENVHSCGWNSSYLLRWPSIVLELLGSQYNTATWEAASTISVVTWESGRMLGCMFSPERLV